MLMRRLFTLIIAAVALCTAAAAQEPITAVVKAEGTLSQVLGDNIEQITSLIVEGPINDTDFITLNKMTTNGSLTHLDLSKAKIAGDAIPERAFYTDYTNPATKLTSVILPEGLKSIGELAFQGGLLESVNLPSTLTKIGVQAFAFCKHLKGEITIPPGITEIPNHTFYRCVSLEKVVFSEGLVSIGRSAFESCEEIKEFNFPATLRTLENDCLRFTGITSITIPETCKVLGFSALAGNFELETLIIQSTCDIPVNFAASCEGLNHLELAEGIRVIGAYAFRGAGLRSVTIPKSVIIIENNAFDCVDLTKVYSLASNPRKGVYYENSFGDNDVTLFVPYGSAYDYSRTTGWWSGFTNIVEVDMAGAEDAVADSDIAVRAEGGRIVITADDVPYSVFTADGRTIATGRAAGTATVEAAPGLYIVRAGATTAKVRL